MQYMRYILPSSDLVEFTHNLTCNIKLPSKIKQSHLKEPPDAVKIMRLRAPSGKP